MAQDDLPADGDLVGAETEGGGLNREGFVDVGGEVEGADHCVHAGSLQGGSRGFPGGGGVAGGRAHAAEPRCGTAAPLAGAERLGAGQNRTLMKAPASSKPTRWYVLLAAVLKSLT
ncbi:hypothetical protein GCM10010259_63680 [Streptomyces daghestanicus]|uniref:Uncharacterized protein n=1 Tax=Streptomyces daghestanicus TaxID=66885 RepID=A0ABQ3Q061_9ACTN|nr:hypothetical protein GCM10010259_63680 [Streptomyces daghestanicus]GHI30647.1 hypothetical protein Sdagh_23770 [Streptomyces daghestanicus]